MQSTFFFSIDLTCLLILLFFILGFCLIFFYLLIDQLFFNRFMCTYLVMVKHNLLATNVLLFISYFQLIFFLVIINLIVLGFCFKFSGSFYFFPGGSCLYFDLSSLSCIFVVNSMLLLYFSILFFKKAINTNFRFLILKPEELFFYFLLHLVSIFLFSCRDFISFFLILEIISFIFFIQTGLYGATKGKLLKDYNGIINRLMEASIKYMIPGLISSLCFLMGLCLIYTYTGLVGFLDLKLFLVYAQQIAESTVVNYLIIFGLVLMVVSFLFKLTVVPFHIWVFSVYSGILQHVVILFSTISKIFYFLSFVKFIIPLCFVFSDWFFLVFLMFGFFSLGLGTVHGFFAFRFNIFVACSGIVNIGICMLSLSLFTSVGNVLSLLNMVVYSFLFLLVVMLVYRLEVNKIGSFLQTIDDFRNFSILNLKSGYSLIFLIFSIVGIPPLLGFYPKILIFVNLFFFKNIFISISFLLIVVISSFFYVRLILYLNLGFSFFDTLVVGIRYGFGFTFIFFVCLLFLFLISSWYFVLDELIFLLQLCLVSS